MNKEKESNHILDIAAAAAVVSDKIVDNVDHIRLSFEVDYNLLEKEESLLVKQQAFDEEQV